MPNNADVVIGGAGPYGLSAATHPRKIPGLQTGVFGRTMSFWKENMPPGMFLRSRDGKEEVTDRLLFGTGYRIDVAKYPFVGMGLLPQIDRIGGYPILKTGLETSVPGLHFLGAPAAWSFGSAAHFVSALSKKVTRSN